MTDAKLDGSHTAASESDKDMFVQFSALFSVLAERAITRELEDRVIDRLLRSLENLIDQKIEAKWQAAAVETATSNGQEFDQKVDSAAERILANLMTQLGGRFDQMAELLGAAHNVRQEPLLPVQRAPQEIPKSAQKKPFKAGRAKLLSEYPFFEPRPFLLAELGRLNIFTRKQLVSALVEQGLELQSVSSGLTRMLQNRHDGINIYKRKMEERILKIPGIYLENFDQEIPLGASKPPAVVKVQKAPKAASAQNRDKKERAFREVAQLSQYPFFESRPLLLAELQRIGIFTRLQLIGALVSVGANAPAATIDVWKTLKQQAEGINIFERKMGQRILKFPGFKIENLRLEGAQSNIVVPEPAAPIQVPALSLISPEEKREIVDRQKARFQDYPAFKTYPALLTALHAKGISTAKDLAEALASPNLLFVSARTGLSLLLNDNFKTKDISETSIGKRVLEFLGLALSELKPQEDNAREEAPVAVYPVSLRAREAVDDLTKGQAEPSAELRELIAALRNDFARSPKDFGGVENRKQAILETLKKIRRRSKKKPMEREWAYIPKVGSLLTHNLHAIGSELIDTFWSLLEDKIETSGTRDTSCPTSIADIICGVCGLGREATPVGVGTKPELRALMLRRLKALPNQAQDFLSIPSTGVVSGSPVAAYAGGTNTLTVGPHG